MRSLVSEMGVNALGRPEDVATSLHLETQNRRSADVTCGFSLCAPVGIRTPNLLIRSQMLYPLSYRRSSAALARREDSTRIADPLGAGEISITP